MRLGSVGDIDNGMKDGRTAPVFATGYLALSTQAGVVRRFCRAAMIPDTEAVVSGCRL